MITTSTIAPQNMEEAILLPLVTTANTTADKITELMKVQQIEKDKNMSLINELEGAIKSLRNALKTEEAETESTTSEYEAKVKILNERVDALAAEIVKLNTKIALLEEQRVGWQNHVQALTAREAYLHTNSGILERAARHYTPPPVPIYQPVAYQYAYNGGCAPGDGRP